MRANGFRPENSSSFFYLCEKINPIRHMDKVLIIDDERQLRGLLARIIGLEGYEVIQAENCAAGLRQLERTRPGARVVRRQTAGRQRSRPGRPDQGDRARCRSDPADRLRQHSGRRAGDQERRVRLPSPKATTIRRSSRC